MTQKPQKNQSEGTTERVVWTPARVLFQGKHAWPELRCPGEPQMNTATSSPRERPSLSTPRHQNNVVLWNRTFDRWLTSAAFNFAARTFAVRLTKKTEVAMKVRHALKMWLGGDSSMKVSGFLSSWKSIQKNSVIQ